MCALDHLPACLPASRPHRWVLCCAPPLHLPPCRAIYKYALDHLPKSQASELYRRFVQFEKQLGDREGIEVRWRDGGLVGVEGAGAWAWDGAHGWSACRAAGIAFWLAAIQSTTISSSCVPPLNSAHCHRCRLLAFWLAPLCPLPPCCLPLEHVFTACLPAAGGDCGGASVPVAWRSHHLSSSFFLPAGGDCE